VFRFILSLAVVAVVASCLTPTACGDGAVTSSDSNAPLPTIDADITGMPQSTPVPAPPQPTPSPSETLASTPTAPGIAPSRAPIILADCIGRAPAPNHVDVVGKTPPQVLAGYARGIYAVSADGSDLRYVADVRPWFPTAEFTGRIVWSPNGAMIAFMGNLASRFGLIVLDPETGDMALFDVPLSVWGIEWDGQGSVVVWGEPPRSPKVALVRVPLDGGAPVQLSYLPPGFYNPVWSPNGQCFALGSENNPKGETNIFAKDGSPLTGFLHVDGPVWSPDGSTLAFKCYDGSRALTCSWSVGSTEPPEETDAGITDDWRKDDSLSSDGIHLASNEGGNVHITDLSTGGEVQVTDSIIPYMGQLLWSPDGSTLLFTYNPPDSDIYVANSDGSDARVLVSGGSPHWSPDGSRIEFDVGQCALGCWGSMYVADTASGSVARLGNYSFGDVVTSLCRGNTEDPWSPDGRYVLYETEGDPDVKAGIYLANPDGSSPFLTTYGDGPSWSPDGGSVTFTGVASDPQRSCLVFTATVPDGDRVPLAKGLRSTWSPRGDLIAFTVNDEIHVINPDGTGERAVAGATAAGTPLYLRWSPDGRMLAVAFVTPTNDWSTYVVDVDNPGPTTYVSEGQVEIWTPDGQKLVIRKNEDRHYITNLVNLDGSGEQKFVDGAGVDWSPDGSKILFSR